MNTANLQLEGLLLAVAAMTRALKDKGLLSQAEIEMALQDAEEVARADPRRPDEMSASNVAAVLFPIRFLRKANESDGGDAFSALAAEVARGSD